MHDSAPHQNAAARLDGWKEIAQYLGRNVRTVQRWERELQLPVRRMGASKGASVFALRSEIDAWLSAQNLSSDFDLEDAASDVASSNDQASDLSLESPEPPARRLTSRRAIVISACIVLLALAAVFTGARLRKATPTNYRIEQNALVVIDAEGHELWRKNFPSVWAVPLGHRVLWIGDLDGDGSTEVLYAHYPANVSEADPLTLYCYSARGKELWSFTPGHTVRTADEVFDPPFGIQNFEVVADHGRNFVVVSSSHYRYYPNQVAILSPTGRLVSEYWHSGALTQIASGDLNHDGKTELYLTGIDNQYRMATMVMLDLDNAAGASAQTNPHYQILDMPVAKERAKAYFRRTCISRALEPYNEAKYMRLGKDNIWVSVIEQPGNDPGASVIASVDYDLTPNLELKTVSVPDFFATVHKQLEKRGVLDHPFTQAELDPLKNLKQP